MKSPGRTLSQCSSSSRSKAPALRRSSCRAPFHGARAHAPWCAPPGGSAIRPSQITFEPGGLGADASLIVRALLVPGVRTQPSPPHPAGWACRTRSMVHCVRTAHCWLLRFDRWREIAVSACAKSRMRSEKFRIVAEAAATQRAGVTLRLFMQRLAFGPSSSTPRAASCCVTGGRSGQSEGRSSARGAASLRPASRLQDRADGRGVARNGCRGKQSCRFRSRRCASFSAQPHDGGEWIATVPRVGYRFAGDGGGHGYAERKRRDS